MKRGLWLVLVWLVTTALLLISCVQDVPETPLTTEDESETTISTHLETPEPKPASFRVSGLTISPAEVTSGSSVTIEVLLANTGELTGTYDVNLEIDKTVEATETVTLEGGSSQKVTFTRAKSTAKTYSVIINGQSGTFTVKARPVSKVVQPPPTPLPDMDAFMKGIHFTDWPWGFDSPRPPTVGELYYSLQADPSLKNLADTGANWISLLVNMYQETISSTNVTRHQYATASDEALKHVIDYAHSLGMRVLLLPAVGLTNDPDHWGGQVGTAFRSENQWQEWFASYGEHINHYASLAQEAGADMFSVGSELGGVTHREDDWRQIIKEVRERFSGPIIYDSLGWFPHGEWEEIKWWDAVDYIAVDVWYRLTDKDDPTIEELRTAWKVKGYTTFLENISKRFNKPFIISEIGYQSKDGTNREPATWTREASIDLQEQADCYQVALEELWGKPWLKGIFWWQWIANTRAGGANDSDYTPYGKPAEEVLKQFYLEK